MIKPGVFFDPLTGRNYTSGIEDILSLPDYVSYSDTIWLCPGKDGKRSGALKLSLEPQVETLRIEEPNPVVWNNFVFFNKGGGKIGVGNLLIDPFIVKDINTGVVADFLPVIVPPYLVLLRMDGVGGSIRLHLPNALPHIERAFEEETDKSSIALPQGELQQIGTTPGMLPTVSPAVYLANTHSETSFVVYVENTPNPSLILHFATLMGDFDRITLPHQGNIISLAVGDDKLIWLAVNHPGGLRIYTLHPDNSILQDEGAPDTWQIMGEVRYRNTRGKVVIWKGAVNLLMLLDTEVSASDLLDATLMGAMVQNTMGKRFYLIG